MPMSSNTVNLAVSGMTEAEAEGILSWLRHMRKVGILAKEVEVERTDTSAADEGVRLSTYGGL